MEGLSPRQLEVYGCIESYYKKKGFSPSISDVAEIIGLSTSTIATYIEALKKKGYVTSERGVPRSLLAVAAGKGRKR